MLKLNKVSKFYYSKGIVATGFTKVSMELNIGEFVAITGESGSGKSTLLNVISGLDSYEEGEMYVNGEETSHYTEKDYEIYRKKYIGNIFQSFNLINSYTVYQNVELVLLINGYKKKDIKYKVLEIINKVGLSKYKNTKVSKLSGGQKQRVAIARCLAKDTPIIIADEPTGNLDSKSADGIIKLLNEISKEKLVVIVTHNYEQVEKYVTRKITMHDGRVIEDIKLKDINDNIQVEEAIYKETRIGSKFRLGVRNTFNVVPKFLLLLLVYLFVVFAISGTYSSFKQGEYESSKENFSYFFSGVNASKRIILKKNSNVAFNEEDFNKIASLDNIDYILKDDMLYDRNISMDNSIAYFYGQMISLDLFKDKIDEGDMPKNDNEIILYVNKNDYNIAYNKEAILGKEFQVYEIDIKLKVVGIKYRDGGYESTFYVSNKILEDFRESFYKESNNTIYNYGGTVHEFNMADNYNNLIASNLVNKGEAYISYDRAFNCKKNTCIGENVNIKTSNNYFTNEINLKITKEYNKNNLNKLTNYNYDEFNGSIFINDEDYKNLFKGENYQVSVFVKNDKEARDTENELKALGYDTFYILDGVNENGVVQIIRIMKVIFLSILIFVLFFISYFVIKLILKSRNIYFSTIRMLGSSSKTTKNLLDIELNLITNIAYFIFVGLVVLVNLEIINISFIKDLSTFLGIKEYIIIYLILFVMSYLTSTRYASKLFKKSAISTYREEV